MRLPPYTQGYLLPIVPSLEAHVEAFVALNPSSASAFSPSPDSSTSRHPQAHADPSTTSSGMTAADAHQASYAASRIPDLMDSVLPPLVPAREAAKATTTSASSSAKRASSSAPGAAAAGGGSSGRPKVEDVFAPGSSAAAGPAALDPYGALPPPPQNALGYGGAALRGPGHPPPLAFPHAHGPGAPLSLHALADAAVPDFDGRALGGGRKRSAYDVGPGGDDEVELGVPELPGEATRNVLLDLYFNQVGQTCLPMLVRRVLSRLLSRAADRASSSPRI